MKSITQLIGKYTADWKVEFLHPSLYCKLIFVILMSVSIDTSSVVESIYIDINAMGEGWVK
jgi:hypothetical protein